MNRKLQTINAQSNSQPPGANNRNETRFRIARAALAEEHSQIMALVGLLKDTPEPALLVRRLEQLHRLLVNHFAREQFPGGLYESMGAFGSRWHDELRELIQDHCFILSEARGILERARKSTPAERDALQADVNVLVERLSRHERKEHRLAERLQSTAANKGA